jgi:DNA topoisomerase VI subunit B
MVAEVSKVAKRKSAGESSAQEPTKRARALNPALTFKSPAEFFAENKNIAGFDNPGKSLYTTVRELIENGLDAAEAVPVTPSLNVTIECIGKEEFRKIVGMAAGRERVDNALYKDVETEKERKKREARERKEERKTKTSQVAGTAEGAGAEGDLRPEESQGLIQSQSEALSLSQSQVLSKERAGGNEIFRVTVRDNGTGMAHDDVPNMMGRVLAGTKYCVKQSRGKFGLGSKMALIWSKMSTGLPVHVRTAQKDSPVTTCVLDIDMAKNIPAVISHVTSPNVQNWRGTEVSVTIQGSWTSYRSKLLLYMRQMAVITPYAEFRFEYKADVSRQDRNFELLFARRTDVMPRASREVKHHPSSVDQYRLKRLISDALGPMTLHSFLSSQFVSVSFDLASRLITELGPGFSKAMPVRDLGANHIRQINELLQVVRFDKPDGSCLSPAGEYNLRLGITKELCPNMVATHAEPADVFEGHAFIVEAGVALGGEGLKPGVNVYRFANRIPLLFEAGNDVVTKTAKEGIRWGNYKISPVSDRIGVICSIVSTKIPFKGTGKEYIGDDAEAIKASVKRAITQCCIQLKAKLVRKAALKDAAERKKSIARYAPDVANAIANVFEAIEDPQEDVADVAEKFKNKEITREGLKLKLIEHVEQFDKEQALEYATTTGRDVKTLEDIFFAPRGEPDMYEEVCCELSPADGADAPPQMLLLKSMRQVI